MPVYAYFTSHRASYLRYDKTKLRISAYIRFSFPVRLFEWYFRVTPVYNRNKKWAAIRNVMPDYTTIFHVTCFSEICEIIRQSIIFLCFFSAWNVRVDNQTKCHLKFLVLSINVVFFHVMDFLQCGIRHSVCTTVIHTAQSHIFEQKANRDPHVLSSYEQSRKERYWHQIYCLKQKRFGLWCVTCMVWCSDHTKVCFDFSSASPGKCWESASD